VIGLAVKYPRSFPLAPGAAEPSFSHDGKWIYISNARTAVAKYFAFRSEVAGRFSSRIWGVRRHSKP
jgi:hypothetical protein